MLNLDANAGYGLLPEVAAAIEEFLPELQAQVLNASSVHSSGQRAKLVLDQARDAIAALVGAPDGATVIFCSGATEACNMAVMAPFNSLASMPGLNPTGFEIVASVVEHDAVEQPIKRLSERGFPVRWVAPKSPGARIEVADVVSAITANTKLLCLMHANNETGEVFPVAEVAEQARKIAPQIFIFCDTVQSVGKLPVSLTKLGVDAVAVSGHKLGALAGSGALVVHPRAKAMLAPQILGGPQEHRLRAGSENVLGIFALGIAAMLHASVIEDRCESMEQLRAVMRDEILSALPDVVIHADEMPRLPNTLSIYVPRIRADDLIVALDLEGVAVSAGAACSSGKQSGSRVLRASGYSEEESRSTLRVSVTAELTLDDAQAAAQKIIQVVQRMRSAQIHSRSQANGAGM